MIDAIFWVVSIMHLTWGALYLTSDDLVLTTGLYFFTAFTHNPDVIGLSLIGVATMSIIGIGSSKVALWSLPQQALLIMASLTALRSAWLGEYPDGIRRSGLFILDDQLPSICLAIIHTLTLIYPVCANLWSQWTRTSYSAE